MTAVEPTTPVPTSQEPRSRRNVLCGLAVALLAPGALVAACSSDSDSGDSGNSGIPTGSGDPTGGGSSGGLAAVADVPDGGGLIVEQPDGPVLLVRNGEEVKGYNAACTHMGTTVDPPQDGVSTCPNHGSQFDVASGDVVQGPATQPLAEVAVQVDGDQIVLA